MPTLRPTDYQTLVKVFTRDGFTFSRHRGDHLYIPNLTFSDPS
jgi:predicted RNA binding protein YcfA (HicA-like mRNA interferase family)